MNIESSLRQHLVDYSSGILSRQRLEEKTGLPYGVILDKMHAMKISLPKEDSRICIGNRQPFSCFSVPESILDLTEDDPQDFKLGDADRVQ